MAKSTAKKPPTKSEILKYLADDTGLTRKEIESFFASLQKLIKKNLGRHGPGEFAVPGLMKIKVVRKPPTKEREGINPFTGEKAIFKAKPARNVVRISAFKGLKDMGFGTHGDGGDLEG